jgi:hypothetical protein
MEWIHDRFKLDGLERLARADREYADAHGYYLPDVAALAHAALEALAACRRERDEVYAVNAANNYDRAIEAREALDDIVAMCEPDRVPLPLLNSKVIRRAREVGA